MAIWARPEKYTSGLVQFLRAGFGLLTFGLVRLGPGPKFLTKVTEQNHLQSPHTVNKKPITIVPPSSPPSPPPSAPSWFHHAPRSFSGVEDLLDDDDNKQYTYEKGKKSKNPKNHVSFKQRTVAYMQPFTLDVLISKRFISASITYRVTCKQVAVAGTNSSLNKDIKAVLKSRSDTPADVYTAIYTPRERDKFEGKVRAVIQSLIDNGINIKVYLD